MAAITELHLVIPGICGPLAEIQPLKNHRIVKDWIKVLSRAGNSLSFPGVYNVLASIFDLTIEGDFPEAALLMLAADKYDAGLNYMCADPVHLQADMDHAVLTSSVDLAITETESAALCEALNQHFNQDGIRFIRTANTQWVLESTERVQLETTPLLDAVGRNVNFILPAGETSVYWKQMLTEAQMLMHSHEINIKRENAGQPVINSLWIHGSGNLPEVNNCRVTSACSNSKLFKGLASHVQCEYLQLPDSASEYTDVLLSSQSPVNLLHLSALEHLVNYSDVNIWLAEFTEVLNHWVYPLLKMAGKNNIKILLYPCNEKKYQFSKYDALKFWRQKNLEQHVKAY